MTHPHLTRLRADERGFSLVVVIMVMMVSSMFLVGAYAAANGDMPLSRDSQDRKTAYNAAEAGLQFYQFKLNQDPDYWTRCTSVPAPNANEVSPVNQSANGADPPNWRRVNVANDPQYAIELLPNGTSTCQTNNNTSMIDPESGTFRVRATGRVSPTDELRRSVVATFRQESFLKFLYFTDYETTDPDAYATGDQAWARSNCGDRYRTQRDDDCREISFIGVDRLRGPMHSNDERILVCGTPTFGRDSKDIIQMRGASPGYFSTCSGGGAPSFVGIPHNDHNVTPLRMPQTNTALATTALPAYTFAGTTTIRLNGANMIVTNNGSTRTMAYPDNGVIYVKEGASCGVAIPPVRATYAEPAGCAKLYISGTYSKSLTVASAGDIIIKPPAGTVDGHLRASGDVLLGLVANQYVRVYHKVNRGESSCSSVNTTTEPRMTNLTIDAAILSLQHSFLVDNYDCAKLGTLTVKGAIAQKYRGPVGTNNNGVIVTGFEKDYEYDDRFRYRTPPFFLRPVDAAWEMVRVNEQVPAVGSQGG